MIELRGLKGRDQDNVKAVIDSLLNSKEHREIKIYHVGSSLEKDDYKDVDLAIINTKGKIVYDYLEDNKKELEIKKIEFFDASEYLGIMNETIRIEPKEGKPIHLLFPIKDIGTWIGARVGPRKYYKDPGEYERFMKGLNKKFKRLV